MTNPAIETAIETFVRMAQGMLDADRAAHNPSTGRDVLTVEKGRRYAKVVRRNEALTSRSVYCFVDRTNGNVLMAATWKAPAKGARGNVLAENPLAGVGLYGANYLR